MHWLPRLGARLLTSQGGSCVLCMYCIVLSFVVGFSNFWPWDHRLFSSIAVVFHRAFHWLLGLYIGQDLSTSRTQPNRQQVLSSRQILTYSLHFTQENQQKPPWIATANDESKPDARWQAQGRKLSATYTRHAVELPWKHIRKGCTFFILFVKRLIQCHFVTLLLIPFVIFFCA